MNYLVVVAHPDDECDIGGTIHKLIKRGNKIAVAILVSNVEARRNLSHSLSEEEAKAMEILGVDTIYHGGFPNIKMNVIPHLDIVQFVEKCIEAWNTEVIITHHPADVNNDHVNTSIAVQAACHLYQRRMGIMPLKELLYMESVGATEWVLDTSSERFTPNCFVEIGQEGIELKEKAMAAYKVVVREFPHPSSIEACKGLAIYRGCQAGCNYAEAFQCVFRRA